MTVSMDPAEKATRFAQAVSEGMNCLAVFLCAPALRKLKAQAPDLLRRWEEEYAPVFQKIDLPAASGDPAAFRAALANISSLVRAGVDPDAADQLASLRAAIRELLTTMRCPLPSLAPSDAAVCELHGSACPVLADRTGA